MPRRPRIHLPGAPIHLVQRGHNRDACFFTDEDYLAYREWLGEIKGAKLNYFRHLPGFADGVPTAVP